MHYDSHYRVRHACNVRCHVQLSDLLLHMHDMSCAALPYAAVSICGRPNAYSWAFSYLSRSALKLSAKILPFCTGNSDNVSYEAGH